MDRKAPFVAIRIHGFPRIYLCIGMLLLLSPRTVNAAVGDLPVINQLQGLGSLGQNFSQAGTQVQLAIFAISNNHENAFDLHFTFANEGKFISGSNEIAMTSILLDKMDIGTLGTGLTEPEDVVVALDGDGMWTWDPGATQTTETQSYHVQLKGSWNNPTGKLAGYYYESITATITIGL